MLNIICKLKRIRWRSQRYLATSYKTPIKIYQKRQQGEKYRERERERERGGEWETKLG